MRRPLRAQIPPHIEPDPTPGPWLEVARHSVKSCLCVVAGNLALNGDMGAKRRAVLPGQTLAQRLDHPAVKRSEFTARYGYCNTTPDQERPHKLQRDGLAAHSGTSIGQSRDLLRAQSVEEREMCGDEVDIGRTIVPAPFVQAREADFVHPESQYEGVVADHALRQAISPLRQ